MSRWETGSAEVQALIDRGALEQVPASSIQSEALLTDAERHFCSAVSIATSDPSAAYAVMYDGARKAMAAILAHQGLRATRNGGHLAVQDAVEAQFGQARTVVRPFNRIRRRRNEAEYPSVGNPTIDTHEVLDDLPKARALAEAAARIIPQMGPWADAPDR